MKNDSIKKRLKNGDRLNGCWIGMFNPVASEIVAMSGYDVILIDLEHAPGSFTDAISVMQAIRGYSCEPIIRASSCDIVDIKRALDTGPKGIMIPNVRNVEEAKQVVAACRYGPHGVRGAAPGIIRATDYGENISAYLEFMDKDFLIIAQIESKEAVSDIQQLAEVEGIDMLFVGPSDLSASLGNLGQYDSPDFKKAVAHIEEKTLGAGKFLGAIPFPDHDPKQLYQAGYSLVLSGRDSQLLKNAAREDVVAMRSAAESKNGYSD